MNATLEALIRLAPPPAQPPTGDWEPVETALHRELPADYKALVDTYGSGAFCGYIELLVPTDVRKAYDIVAYNDGRSDFAAEIWEEEDEQPEEFSDDLGYELIAWAKTIDGDTLNWLAHPDQKPASWRTLLVSRDVTEAWEHYDTPAPAVLLGLLTGDIASGIVVPDRTHVTFEAYA
ncbi:SMI1/KNR4 family protein [Streptomyces gilvus]|uniref:SMI1/KNR4 family protein n=1 Tax=Streptomyces gilvus TaxID=2920937 RepID=UPI001F0D0C5F|nr:SMI1/KNR4 family protein [Streptomyces sp. CME 23]MCH5676123.1 SMI1/KNR4 family protein [Streptomyces sp. CME 23]